MRGSPIPCPEISASAAFCAYWFNVVPPSERPTFSAIATCKSVDAGEWRPPLSAPSPGSGNNWRPSGQPPYQRQPPPVRQQWSPGSAEQQPSGVVNSPPYRPRGCHVYGWPGCHSDFHREGAVSPQAPPSASGCFVCGQRWCHSSRHEGYERPPTPQPPVVPPPGSVTVSDGPQSNFQRSPLRGAGTPPAVACPQNN